MADETLTGAATDVQVNNAAADAKAGQKKLIIKVLLIAAGLFAAYWLYKKFVK